MTAEQVMSSPPDVQVASIQELFDYSVGMLIQQGKPSNDCMIRARAQCLYRGVAGAKCAIGWLIPDNKYRPEMEQMVLSKVLPLCGWNNIDQRKASLLFALQGAHDYAQTNWWLIDFKNRARRVAERFELNTDVLDRAL